MIITIFAVLMAALVAYFNLLPPDLSAPLIAFWLLAGGTAVLVVTSLLIAFAYNPLMHLEQELVPNVIGFFRKDWVLRINWFILFFFSFLSYFLAAGLAMSHLPPVHHIIILGWFIAFAIALDLIHATSQRILHSLNPTFLIERLAGEARTAIQNENDPSLWNSLDDLAEVTIRSLEKSKIALSTQALQAFPPILNTFFASSKSISRINIDKQVEQETGRDEASYTIFYLLQRLEVIYDRALEKRLETVCRQMIIVMGKIIVYSAKFDLSMVSFPTHFLTKFGLKALQYHFQEVTVLTTSTLLEIAKTIISDIDLTYAELQEPFRSIINGLNAIAKATFKKDKTTSIQVLVQPLVDLRNMFQSEKLANHQDTPVILAEIDSLLTEYETLAQVMRTIPPISVSETEETPS